MGPAVDILGKGSDGLQIFRSRRQKKYNEFITCPGRAEHEMLAGEIGCRQCLGNRAGRGADTLVAEIMMNLLIGGFELVGVDFYKGKGKSVAHTLGDAGKHLQAGGIQKYRDLT
ncbi:MAG: hypothetical protein UX78_C0008G0029 [Candidatus Amesbacteria bacterium GW2011_GWA2_47_11]|uniref:Uncharacterized protein n=1 Tax=Candidatus Amesbacteria bacterium GW2011_GWA2_47_11 TaxID=1618357 RepID=A0A0G1UFH5_9BACT|nr:MAG: hypothetical protein UX78_C0008G0029 [Candidatus Amesbacteria bacterium GW2011_GWA2_47_11]